MQQRHAEPGAAADGGGLIGFWDIKLTVAPAAAELGRSAAEASGGAKRMVPLRFEVSLNGRRLCVAGLDQLGVLMLTVQSENWPGDNPAESTRGTPAGDESTVFVNAYTDGGEDWRWAHERIKAGDEIVVRVLPAGEYDPPTEFGPPEDE